MNNYLASKLKIFHLQNKQQFALVNKKFKKIFFKKKFSSKFISPNLKDFKKIKHKIKNDYLAHDINNENMSFIFTFAKLLKIKENSFINSMKSFKGLTHRFEFF